MKNISLSSPHLGKEEIKIVTKTLKSNWLGMGPKVNIFENKLKKFFQSEVACVSSGTAAIHLALQALKIKKKDEILVSANTFVATFQAISATGAIPIPCDINIDDFSLNLDDAKKKITRKTKVIMPVHYAGGSNNLEEIYKFAKKNKLRVVEDAAHAFGSYYKNKKIGSFGDIICFSFDPIKNITCGEGGCVVSKNTKIIKNIKTTRFLGIVNESDNRYQKKKNFLFKVNEQGWRYHMSDINASIGIAQLKKWNNFKKKRKNLIMEYIKLLSKNKNLSFLNLNYKKIFSHIFIIKSKKIFNIEKIKTILKKKGINIGYHWLLPNKLDYYKSKVNLPNCDYISRRMITLPLHAGMKFADVKYICKELLKIIK